MKFFKKYHKWLSIVLTVFIILYAISGIILNHRKQLSSIGLSRNVLPSDYQYKNWNLAAIKGSEKISADSILLYGNIGVFLTNEKFSKIVDFNAGFGRGVDNHKIEKVFYHKGNLLAATLFGLYKFDFSSAKWKEIFSPDGDERMLDIAVQDGKYLLMSRSFIYKSSNLIDFEKIELLPYEGYDNKIGLFKTLWVIHSGEIYGLPGVLLVDLIAIIFVFLTLTGLVYFLVPFFIKKHKHDGNHKIKKFNRWSLKWHNKIGWITLVLLVITTFTGMFLRPPLLAAIAYSKVGKIPYTELDTPNAWFDKLRRILVDEKNNRIFIASNESVFLCDNNFNNKPIPLPKQPPISVMGVNVFEQIDDESILVGSFEGLFAWNFEKGLVYDVIKNKTHRNDPDKLIPLGDYLVTGFSSDFIFGNTFFDFNIGAQTISSPYKFPDMPQNISSQKMSLWNVALEFHTGRMYKFFGKFYILFVPLSGFIILFILISGFIVWWKKHRKKTV